MIIIDSLRRKERDLLLRECKRSGYETTKLFEGGIGAGGCEARILGNDG